MTVDSGTKERGMIYAQYRPPAPIYERKTTVGLVEHCQTFHKAPGYSIGLKRNNRASDIPGPGYAYDPYMTNKGRQVPASKSLSGRHALKDPEIFPGPGAYDSHKMRSGTLSNERKSTSISCGTRTNWPFKNEAPPANAYTIRTGIGSGALHERQPPSWSLRPKSLVGGSQYELIKANNPGPGSYKAIEPNVFKKTSGVYSMQGRTRVPNYNSIVENPGPGSYEPSAPKTGRRGPSIGVRHSEYTVPLITDIDCRF